MLLAKSSNPPQDLPLFNGTRESTLAEDQLFCDKMRDMLDRLAAEIPIAEANFGNVLLPVSQVRNEEFYILSFYSSASPGPEVREASVATQKFRAAISIECFKHEDILRLVDSAYH